MQNSHSPAQTDTNRIELSSPEEALSRRVFLRALVQIGALGGALSGCSSQSEPPATQSSQNPNAAPGPIPVAARKEGAAWRVADGAKVPAGQALFFEIREGSAPPRTGYLLRDKQNWLALDAKCPHAGCDVEWKNAAFGCPCHASQFTAQGKRTGGPATRDLGRWKVKIDNQDALISLV